MSGTTSLSNIVGSVKGFFGLKGQTTVKPFAGEPVQLNAELTQLRERQLADGTRITLFGDLDTQKFQLGITRPGEKTSQYYDVNPLDAGKRTGGLGAFETSAGTLRIPGGLNQGTFEAKYPDGSTVSMPLQSPSPGPESTPRLE